MRTYCDEMPRWISEYRFERAWLWDFIKIGLDEQIIRPRIFQADTK
jgi:hypothetical protein